MNVLKQTKRFLFLMLIGVFIFSCNEDEKLDLNESITQSENFVTIGEVTDICTAIEYPTTVKSSKNEIINRNIESITEITDELDKPLYYITNFVDGGFVIISADNRLHPILAYSESNAFDINPDDFPEGLVNWLDYTKNKVKKIRKSNATQKPEIKHSWDELLGRTAPLPGDDDGDGEVDPCEDIHYHVEPLLTTLWYQNDGFNDLAPDYGCDGGEQALAGCVAVAMAQVMRFYEYPNNYNWADMPNFEGTSETAQLMRDIGDAVNMNWGCTGSGASPTEIASSLKEDFGYSNANFSDYNRNTVVYELNRNRPVILGGYGTGGHAWVCDGYVKSTYCNGTSYLVLHMNWGWKNTWYNGYYGYCDWTPGNAAFNDDRKMITNIIP